MIFEALTAAGMCVRPQGGFVPFGAFVVENKASPDGGAVRWWGSKVSDIASRAPNTCKQRLSDMHTSRRTEGQICYPDTEAAGGSACHPQLLLIARNTERCSQAGTILLLSFLRSSRERCRRMVPKCTLLTTEGSRSFFR